MSTHDDYDAQPVHQSRRWRIYQDGHGWHLEELGVWGRYERVQHYQSGQHFAMLTYAWKDRDEIIDYIKFQAEQEKLEDARRKILHEEYL